MTRSQWSATAAAAAVALLLYVTGAVAAQESRFFSSQETGGAPGRYRVELRPGDDLIAISGQLAATYGARIEPYAEEGFHGFAIAATPTRARLMSSDPRVVAVTDLNPPVNTAKPVEAVVATKADTPTVAVEQTRGITTEAVPGFGNYAYDPSGNITSIDTQDFRYDAFGRLQSADLGTFGTQAYTYDRYGNILKIVTDGDDVNAARMSVDPETNRMDLPFSGSNPANMIATYDGVGNLITHNGSFVYDALNKMKEATDTARRLHVYSASDERVVVVLVVNGVEKSSEWTLRDGANRVLRRLSKDVAGAWHWKEDYVYGGTQLLAAEVPGPERVRHFHADHLGTPRMITGNGGARIIEKTYDPFGRKVSPAGDDFEQLEFTGHERDTPALDYMHARYYQPDLGRFFSTDPVLGEPSRPQTWNRYSYANNNPVNVVDPTGMYETSCGPTDLDCKLNAAIFEGSRSQALESEDPAVRAAAAAYGQPDEANGVLVTFDGTTNGNPAETTATTMWSMPWVLGPVGRDGTRYMGFGAPSPLSGATVTFNGQDSITPANVAHEGVHVSHALQFFQSWNGSEHTGSQVTQYFTESAAYHVTAAFAPPNGTMNVGQHEFRRNMTAEQRQAVVNAILRDPALGYNVTPNNQGGAWPP